MRFSVELPPTYATLIEAESNDLVPAESIDRAGIGCPVEDGTHLDDWLPRTEDDRNAVRSELKRILADKLFRNSSRYPLLLQYVVEETLAGRDAYLKERTLGVAVFSRAPDYDTNQDTIVRLTAGEIRKRIAQFYHQSEEATPVQIDLRPGSYVPVFRRLTQKHSEKPPSSADIDLSHPRVEPFSKTDSGLSLPEESRVEALAKVPIASTTQPIPPPTSASQQSARGFLTPRRWLWLGTAALVLVAALVLALWHQNQLALAADRQLWAPFLEDPGQVHLVIADLSATVSQSTPSPDLANLLRMGEVVNYRDILAQTELVAFLARHNKPLSLVLSTHATYTELQRSPSVLIGGLDNLWTMRVTSRLRFYFAHRGSTSIFSIEDRQQPKQGGWAVDLSLPKDRITEDYAIVARVFDQTTGQPVIVVAGLGANGTSAAAQFLIDPARAAELAAHAPRDWRRMNMEAVLRTQILDNHAGPPQLVSCYFW